jgi:hypothetical protein
MRYITPSITIGVEWSVGVIAGLEHPDWREIFDAGGIDLIDALAPRQLP